MGIAHAVGWAANAVAGALSSTQPGSSDPATVAKQLLWAGAAGLMAARGPTALLASIQTDTTDSRAASGSPKSSLQACTVAAGLAAAVLQGCALLMGHWVRCTAFLLAVVPLYAVSLMLQPFRLARVAVLLAPAPAAYLLPRLLHAAGAPWLVAPLVTHVVVVCLSLV